MPHTFAFFANVWALYAPFDLWVRKISLRQKARGFPPSLIVISMHPGRRENPHIAKCAMCGAPGMKVCGIDGLIWAIRRRTHPPKRSLDGAPSKLN